MRLFTILLFILLATQALAQSRPVTGSHSVDGRLTSHYEFTYDSKGDPETVIVLDPEGVQKSIHSDFVRMPGWYRYSAHPLYPEYYALASVTLRLIEGAFDTIAGYRRILGPFGLTSTSESQRVSSTQSVTVHKEFVYTVSGQPWITRSWSVRYENGGMVETFDEASDTALLEYRGDELLSYYVPRMKQKQIYAYRQDGSLLRVEILDMSSNEPRVLSIVDEIRTRKFTHPINEPSFDLQMIYALVNEPIVSATMRKWSDQLQGLDTALSYSAGFDDLGRLTYRNYEGYDFDARFSDEGFQQDVTYTLKRDTVEYRHRFLLLDGQNIVAMHDTVVGISIIDGMIKRGFRDYVFEYAPASVKTINAEHAIAVRWDAPTGSLQLELPESPNEARLYSITGSMVAKFDRIQLQSRLYLPDLRTGVYIFEAHSADNIHRAKFLVQ